MERFVYGNSKDWDALKNSLIELEKEHRMDVYSCKMPPGCKPEDAKIAFEKIVNSYFIYIDRTVTTEIDNADFSKLLRDRSISFDSVEDISDFFIKLRSFYEMEGSDEDSRISGLRKSPYNHTVDYEAVKEEMLNERARHVVRSEDITTDLKQYIVGQDEAVQIMADTIEIALNRKAPKLINFAFLGPTATGKSETGRALAKKMSELTGKKYGFIECAGNEFVSEHSVHRFLGAPPGFVGYGKETILDPVRKNPYHVIVINEVEKADDRLLVALMEAIDTGFLGMADNSKPINLNNCIMIFTSNIKIDMDKYDRLNDYEKVELCMDAFTEHCGRPEISGKISNFIVFRQLSDEANIAIVEKFAIEVFDSFDIELVEIDPKLVSQFVQYKSSYGARAIRTMVDRIVGRQLLHSGQIEALKHRKVKMFGDIENIVFEAV